MPITKKTVRTKDGQKIYYEVYAAEGQRPRVFFVHGIGGDADAWQFVRDALLDRGIPSMALDLRGHGHSSHPRPFASYTTEHCVGDIVAVLEEEGIEKVALVGHSWGAVVALNFALAHHDRLEKLGIISGTHAPPWYMRSHVLRTLVHASIAALAFVSPPPVYPGHSKYPSGKFHKDLEWLGLVRTVARNSLRSHLLTLKLFMNIDVGARLGGIAVPTLIMAGAADTLLPPSTAPAMHAAIPGSRLFVVRGGNHVLILNNAKEVSAELCDFLASSR